MSDDTALASLLERNSELFTLYGAWAIGQIKVLVGTIDDPESFNADGGKTGALGYYPVDLNGTTFFAPSLARMQVIAAGGGDLGAIEAVLAATVQAREATLVDADRASSAASAAEGFAEGLGEIAEQAASAGALLDAAYTGISQANVNIAASTADAKAARDIVINLSGVMGVQPNPATPTVPPPGLASGAYYWAAISGGEQLYLNNAGTGAPVLSGGAAFMRPSKALVDRIDAVVKLDPASAVEDDDISPSIGLPVVAAFAEKSTKRARAFLTENGFGGKVLAFLFGGQPQDDDSSPVWGMTLSDGKMPLQADADWKFYMKLQDRSVVYIRNRLTALTALMWRGPTGYEDLRASPKMVRALITDNAFPLGFYGEIGLPAGSVTTQAIATGAGAFHGFFSTGQSTGGSAGQDSSQMITNVFPYHVVKFSAGSSGNSAVATDAATLNDLLPSFDSQKPNPAINICNAMEIMDRMAGVVSPTYLNRVDNKGGSPITDMIKTTPAARGYVYSNLMTSIVAGAARAAERGLSYRVTISNSQGETSASTKADGTTTAPTTDNPANTVALIQGYVAQWVDDLTADVKAAVRVRPLIIDAQTIGRADPGGEWWADNFNGSFARLIEQRLRRGSNYLWVGPRHDLPVGVLALVGELHPIDEGVKIEAARRALVDRRARAGNPYPELDIARVNAPGLFVGDDVRARGVAEVYSGTTATPTRITALGTGTGGVGTYTVNHSQLVGRRKMHAGGAIFWGRIDNGAGAAGTLLTVDQIDEGALSIARAGPNVITIDTTLPCFEDSWVPGVGPGKGFTITDPSGATVTDVALAPHGRGTRITITMSANLTGTAGQTQIGHADVVCATQYLKIDALNCTASFAAVSGVGKMTVTAASANTIAAGDPIIALGIAGNTTVVSQDSGTSGGAGVYTISTVNTLSARSIGVRWNWSSTRSPIMHDTGVAQPFYEFGFRVPSTIRFGLPRFRHRLP